MFVIMAFLIHQQSGTAQIVMPKIFSDNMVLQRDEPLMIWGKYLPGETVQVKFSSLIEEVEVQLDSSWQVYFPAHAASSSPQLLSIYTKSDSLEYSNVLIGDVWLLAGQSNMEWSLGQEEHFESEKEQLAGPQLRFYNPQYVGKGIYAQKYNEEALEKLQSTAFFEGSWEESGMPHVAKLSAIGYYFGKEILQHENIPVGLINLSIGGAPIEAFISEETLEKDQRFYKKVSGNWLDNDELPVWIRERGGQNVGGIAVHVGKTGPNHAYKPGFIYESGIKPILNMPIKGVLWYQGESNAQEIARVFEYPQLQKLLIKDYRKKWKQETLPFYWVQLSSIDTLNYRSQYWPLFRNLQRLLLEEVNYGGMAVSSDVGAENDVHPRNKKVVGERLARWALHQDYDRNIEVSGPLPIDAKYSAGKIKITFEHTADGLMTLNGEMVKGFSLNGKHPVPATIEGSKIIIQTSQKPETVYYGWQPYSTGNLMNSEESPTSTFQITVDD
ncbi:sialate O-acetylesterase [Salinimicrobium tongyeongense]|uniref:Sialate O-acetylesterase n=2 Tax=Salinimicrobium tongyeongense TaxID=2809707 RepID=A0ABY6NW37_9FLAO|nr:sialate O-acetylesterase [Salinimicrobium tongyeongense]